MAAVFEAIRADRIRRVSPTGGLPRLLAMLCFIFFVHPILVRLPGSKRRRARRTAQPTRSASREPATAASV